MNAIEHINAACGLYIGISERGLTALACLDTAGVSESRALGIVARQLADDVEQQDAKQVAYWKQACDYMPNDTARRLRERKEITARLRAMVPAPKLHPVMADALRGFGGVA